MQNGAEVSEVQLTDEPHPFPELRDMQRDILRYKRNDGVELHAELFTPPGYDKDKDGRLPCLLWAYPKCAIVLFMGCSCDCFTKLACVCCTWLS